MNEFHKSQPNSRFHEFLFWVNIGISIYLKNNKMPKNTGYHHQNIILKYISLLILKNITLLNK